MNYTIEPKANLTWADLTNANLTGANLIWANLTNAKLTNADLTNANLTGANLTGANLTGADLTGANLTGANLTGADLTGADLRKTKGVIGLGTPNGWTALAWIRDGHLSIRVGCREFRYEEALAYWNNHRQGREARLEQLAATEYARQIALARGWEL